jgi:hypothetical protein
VTLKGAWLRPQPASAAASTARSAAGPRRRTLRLY